MAGPLKCTREQVIAAAHRQRGLISRMATDLGVIPATVYSYRKRWKSVARAIEDCRERLVDNAENALWDKVDEQDMRAITFTLSTIGANRGYVKPVGIEDMASGVSDTMDAKLRKAARKVVSESIGE